MYEDIIDRLRIDPGKRTLGELLRDREAALYEIQRLRADIERLRTLHTRKKPESETLPDTATRQSVLGPGILLRLTDVCELLSIPRSTVYKKMSEGTFPSPVRIGERAIRWRVEDIEAWRGALAPWLHLIRYGIEIRVQRFFCDRL
jgi:predicted DNA-binding transcriptional regulator AlpA